jgi:DNA gyrase/topoisomerase IV subunit A
MVQKGKLIEQIAALIADKKLPILEDVRDESDEQIRIVLVPKSRNVDPDLLKESLYRLTDLETRFGLNLNVLDSQRTPGVLGLKLLLQEWVVSQIDIMLRRTQHRLDKIAARLELLEGYIIAYLNLDRIIEIIRTEDEPKPVMMAEFGLTDRQAEAILNMRLRSCASWKRWNCGASGTPCWPSRMISTSCWKARRASAPGSSAISTRCARNMARKRRWAAAARRLPKPRRPANSRWTR